MKVRPKSEIAEAVQWDGTMENWPIKSDPEDCGAVKGTWLIFRKEGHKRIWTIESEKDFAAHYEPVPEPPARIQGCVHSIPTPGCASCDVWRKELGIPAPHRATIAMIPCSIFTSSDKHFHIEVDGVELMHETVAGKVFCEREEIAKAKLESLRGENNGDVGD